MSLQNCAAYVGIDWADQEHAVCVIDAKTQKQKSYGLDQEANAIDEWIGGLQHQYPNQKIAVCLEQKRGALIYALMKFECLILVPVNPQQLARFRSVFGVSGAKNDPNDATLLAELLIKHMDRLRPWHPDGESTRKIRLLTEDRRNLVDERTALTNRLKSRLKQYYPLALQVMGDRIFGNLACQLLTDYPTLQDIQAASDEELTEFYHKQQCYRQDVIDRRLERIRQATPLTTDRPIIESSVLLVRMLVAQLVAINEAIEQYDMNIASLMRTHQDAKIFESFPGAGNAMAPRLLAALGSDRDRVGSAQEIQQMSGIAPVTKQSGKSKIVHRRWACNRFLLQTFHEYAAHSIRFSVWAQAYYDMMRARGCKHQAAVRALAFKWIRIIVACWKNHGTYDEVAYAASLMKRKSPILKYFPSSTP